jgi:hypothetical protein
MQTFSWSVQSGLRPLASIRRADAKDLLAYCSWKRMGMVTLAPSTGIPSSSLWAHLEVARHRKGGLAETVAWRVLLDGDSGARTHRLTACAPRSDWRALSGSGSARPVTTPPGVSATSLPQWFAAPQVRAAPLTELQMLAQPEL